MFEIIDENWFIENSTNVKTMIEKYPQLYKGLKFAL